MKPKEIAPKPNSLVASAARVRAGSGQGVMMRGQSSAWHLEAWEHYRNIGEFRYSCDWIGSMLSKALIHVTVETVDGIEKVTDGSALDYLSALFGNADGRAEMFRMVGIHMSVTGECYIVGYPDPDPFGDGEDKWEVTASTKCLRPSVDHEPWSVNDVVLTDVNPDDVTAIRIWRPDPLQPRYSISPTRSVLSTLRQLHKLGQYISAQLDSRLAGAGILLMPDTMTLPPAPVAEGQSPLVKSANNADELMSILMEAMTSSLIDQDSAAAKVPIVVTASAESIAAVKHLTFWSELDQHAAELRKEAIGRLALGMDVPPEVLQGASDSNHWSAWQADESAIKAHAEPLLKIITTALGSGYLRPLLSVDADYEGERLSAYSIAADTSEMRLRPNRSKEAIELHALGVLSDEALLRECGFDPDDLPTTEGLAAWLTRKVALGVTTPEIVEAALRELGVNLTVIHDTEAPENIRDVIHDDPLAPPTPVTPGTPAPSLKDLPTRNIPSEQVSQTRGQARAEGRVPSSDVARKASLLAASEQLVFRALERAGNRLKNKMGGLKVNCSAAELYTFATNSDPEELLIDAWSGVPLVAKRAGIPSEQLELALAAYTGDLIENQRPHTYEEMDRYLSIRIDMEAAA